MQPLKGMNIISKYKHGKMSTMLFGGKKKKLNVNIYVLSTIYVKNCI